MSSSSYPYVSQLVVVSTLQLVASHPYQSLGLVRTPPQAVNPSSQTMAGAPRDVQNIGTGDRDARIGKKLLLVLLQ